jgi:hypothetical protein
LLYLSLLCLGNEEVVGKLDKSVSITKFKSSPKVEIDDDVKSTVSGQFDAAEWESDDDQDKIELYELVKPAVCVENCSSNNLLIFSLSLISRKVEKCQLFCHKRTRANLKILCKLLINSPSKVSTIKSCINFLMFRSSKCDNSGQERFFKENQTIGRTRPLLLEW